VAPAEGIKEGALMKISIDGILGSAGRLKNQIKLEDDTSGGKKKNIGDTVEIRNRIDVRLDQIQRELKDIQSSITKNQTIKEGINRLSEDMKSGSQNTAQILGEVMYEKKAVLRDFTGENINRTVLDSKMERVDKMIMEDVSKLTRLSVEVENIMASNITGPERADDLLKNVESNLSKVDMKSIAKMSRLNADAVMRLIR
jgi:hypothetical protein